MKKLIIVVLLLSFISFSIFAIEEKDVKHLEETTLELIEKGAEKYKKSIVDTIESDTLYKGAKTIDLVFTTMDMYQTIIKGIVEMYTKALMIAIKENENDK